MNHVMMSLLNHSRSTYVFVSRVCVCFETKGIRMRYKSHETTRSLTWSTSVRLCFLNMFNMRLWYFPFEHACDLSLGIQT